MQYAKSWNNFKIPFWFRKRSDPVVDILIYFCPDSLKKQLFAWKVTPKMIQASFQKL